MSITAKYVILLKWYGLTRKFSRSARNRITMT